MVVPQSNPAEGAFTIERRGDLTVISGTEQLEHIEFGLEESVSELILKPEKVKSVEIGVKSDWGLGDWRFRTNAALYNSDFKAIQASEAFTQAVNGLNSLTSSLAPTSSASATALSNLAQTVAILAKNSSQFETLLQSLDDVSSQGRSLLENYYPQIVTQLQALQAVSSQLAQHQSDLAGLLSQIPAADSARVSTPSGQVSQT